MVVVIFRSRLNREALAVVEFESAAALDAWREHAEHRAAQALGRERFFSSYRIQVCGVQRDYGWPVA